MTTKATPETETTAKKPGIKLLTVNEAAKRLNCSKSSVYALLDAEELGHYRCPGIRISEEQLAEYVSAAERASTRDTTRLHPRTGEPANEQRAEWADKALAVFHRREFHEELADAHPGDVESSIGDLICDLLHSARARGIKDLRGFLDNAYRVFEEEEDAEKVPYYRCGICDNYHMAEWDGDCREKGAALQIEQITEKHGENGWKEVPMPGSDETCEEEDQNKNQHSGTVVVCMHTIAYRYWGFKHEKTEDLKSRLASEAEERAKHLINEGYHSGELNCLYEEEEIRGWWEIKTD